MAWKKGAGPPRRRARAKRSHTVFSALNEPAVPAGATGELAGLATSPLAESLSPTASCGEVDALRWGVETFYRVLEGAPGGGTLLGLLARLTQRLRAAPVAKRPGRQGLRHPPPSRQSPNHRRYKRKHIF